MSPTDLALKGAAVEEWADLKFFRPLGLRVARWLLPSPVTADQVTIAATLLGVLAGHLFYYDGVGLNLLGLVLFIGSDILDSSDGQLARLRGTSTRFGRMLDGISDSIRFIALYGHLFARAVGNGIDPSVAFWLLLATALSHAVQSSAADFIRQLYLYLTGAKSELDLPEDVDRIAAVGWWRRISRVIYRDYVSRQARLCPRSVAVVRAVRDGRPPADLAGRWAGAERPVIAELHWIGTNVRFPLLAILALTGSVATLSWITIVGLNAVLVTLLIIHERRAAGIGRAVDGPVPLTVQEA